MPLGLSAYSSSALSRTTTARFAVATIFFLYGILCSNWFARIPAVQQRLQLGPGALGFALLGMPFGALFAMPAAGWWVGRQGSRRVTTVTSVLYCLVASPPTFAPGMYSLFGALTLWGAVAGALNVAMNAQAVAVEAEYGRPIMSSFHGAFSVGGMVGASCGAVLASRELDPRTHLLLAATFCLAVTVYACQSLLPSPAIGHASGPTFALPKGVLVRLGVVAFCTLLGEGAMADWSAVYLKSSLGTGAGFAASGYAVFSCAMAAGRLTGDQLTLRLGPIRLLRIGSACVSLGLTTALIVGTPFMTVIGYACVGAGLSVMVPLVFSAAGRQPEMPPAASIAAVTTLGYVGFLVGPSVIGFAAELVGLRWALAAVAVLAALASLLARPADFADSSALVVAEST